jgi:tetratricopeptide (TPR) repeat protein
MAESLVLIQDDPDALKMANELMAHAIAGRLEEREIKKIAINYRKMRENEKAVDFLNEAINKIPQLAESAALLELRAKSKIDLAKKCIDTAKNPDSSYKMKVRAWDQCRAYLNDAEKDLSRALEVVTNEVEKEYILRDIEFLKSMQESAKKPNRRSAHHHKTFHRGRYGKSRPEKR